MNIDMSQCDQILDWLQKQGSITPAQAYEQFGTLAMHSRAAELRERGYDVRCSVHHNGRTKYGVYFLAQQA